MGMIEAWLANGYLDPRISAMTGKLALDAVEGMKATNARRVCKAKSCENSSLKQHQSLFVGLGLAWRLATLQRRLPPRQANQ